MLNFILPVLVFLPMAGAVASYILGRKTKSGRNTFVSILVTIEAALAVALLVLTASGQSLQFAWEGFCGLGLHFKVDGFRALYMLVAAFMWMMTGLFSTEYFAHYHNRNRYYFFTLMTLGATAGVFLSNDLYTTFIFFEIMSFTSYAWVAHEETDSALKAAELYLGIALVGGMVTLMGLFMLYNKLGTLSFEGLYEAAKAIPVQELYLPGALCLTGFAAKAGMFPLHIWLPKAHPVAPAPASALLSGILTKAGIFGILVTTCNLFAHDAAWGNAILFFGVLTMVVGALLALFSVDLKRTLACSSMSQIGFILVGVGMQGLLGHHNALAVQGTLLHMVNHSLIKLCLFMAAGVVYMNLHKLNLNDVRGFGRKKPLLHFAFLMGALGITGVPLWNGYISKSLIHESILEFITLLNQQGLAAFNYQLAELLFVITGGLTLAYMLKLYICLFWEKHPEKQAAYDGMKKYMNKQSTFALVGAAIVMPVLGMLPDLLMTGIATLGQGFMHGEAPAHAVHYFSGENLIGAAKSIVIGVALYFAVVRPLLMAKDEKGQLQYVNRWPAWLDFEQIFIRSNLFYKAIPGVITAVTRFFDGLVSSTFVYKVIPGAITAITRCFDELIDGTAILLRHSVLRHRMTPAPVPVGTRFTYTAGVFLNNCATLLNKRVLRNHPITTDFVYLFDASRKEINKETRRITRSLSFSLLLLCIGLYLTTAYLLAQ